jgi:Gamma interferon inducible lysosomal thiol reductase (GILT)
VTGRSAEPVLALASMAHRVLAVLALPALLLAVSCQREESTGSSSSQATSQSSSADTVPAAKGAPVLELFVMSQCPYGVQVVDAAADAKKQLGSAMDLRIQYIGDQVGGKLQSMHGDAEVKGDLAQVCALELAPKRALGMIVCQNKNPKAVAENWRECAEKNGIEVAPLQKCIEGEQGNKLLAASFAEAKKRGASGSPTMFLAGKPYEGGRKSRDFMRAVCGSVKGDKPEACSKIPVPPKVNAIFLSDKRCEECDIRQLEPRLRSELGGLQVEHVDYSSQKGQTLYKQLVAANVGFKTLPTVLLGPEVEKDKEGYGTLQRFLRPVGAYRELRLGGEWDPTAEICDNKGVDDDGNGKADCSDKGCADFLGCRDKVAKKLDLFIMSQCPYGAQAMIAAKEFTDHFKGDVKLDVHFIGDVQDGKLSSMHGQAEVDEDVRERCAVEHYGKNHQFMRYLACRSRDYQNAEWQPCAKEAEMDPAVLQKCFDGNGKELVGQSFAFAKSLDIGASPTFLVNNQRDFNAISASQIQKEYCKDNPSLAPCKDLIPEPAGHAAAGQAAAPGQCN